MHRRTLLAGVAGSSLASALPRPSIAQPVRWFEAPDRAAQKAFCEDMQREAFANPPFLPLGQWKQPWAFRTNLKNFVRCGNVLFWGVERA